MNGYIYNFYICVCEHSLQLHFIIFPHKHRKKLAICGNETEKSGSNPYSKVMRNTEYTIHKTLHAVCFCMRSLSFLHIFGSKYSLLCKWDKNATQTIFSLRNLIVNFFFFLLRSQFASRSICMSAFVLHWSDCNGSTTSNFLLLTASFQNHASYNWKHIWFNGSIFYAFFFAFLSFLFLCLAKYEKIALAILHCRCAYTKIRRNKRMHYKRLTKWRKKK